MSFRNEISKGMDPDKRAREEYEQRLRAEADMVLKNKSNSEIYDYVVNGERQDIRDVAIHYAKYDYEKAFSALKEIVAKQKKYYKALIVLEQIELKASQESLGEVAIWLAEHECMRPFAVVTFSQYITDRGVQQRIKEYLERNPNVCHKKNIIEGLDCKEKYSAKKPSSMYNYDLNKESWGKSFVK